MLMVVSHWLAKESWSNLPFRGCISWLVTYIAQLYIIGVMTRRPSTFCSISRFGLSPESFVAPVLDRTAINNRTLGGHTGYSRAEFLINYYHIIIIISIINKLLSF